MNVIAYTRVSTDGQCGDDKFGLDVQKEQIKEYCDKNDMTIVKWFTDEGESGAKFRPGFDEIIYGEVTNPPYEAVIVAKSDRVARDIEVYFYYRMMLRMKNIQLISIAEDFGRFGVFAPILESFTMFVAQMERDNITKRTSAGRNAKAKTGGYSGGRPPMGYKAVDGRLVIVPEEAECVRKVFEMRDEGKTILAIVDALKSEGFRTRKGTEFGISHIQNILNNRKLYEGYYKYGTDEWIPGEHEAILK